MSPSSSQPSGELQISSMVESVRDYAILMLDPTGHIVTWNDGAERFKGWRSTEIIGQHFSVFYPPEDVDSGKLEMELECAARDGRFEDEGWRVRKDGSRFWANVVITAVRGPEGDLLGYGKVTRDVTDRHEAELALRRSEARFRSVTESATDAIISAGPDGRITTWNPAASRLFGYASADALGQPLTMLVPVRDRRRTRSLFARTLAADTSLEAASAFEVTGLRSDGVELPIEVSVGSWELDGARNFCGIMRDMTERKRIESQLHYLADHDPLTGLYNRRRFETELQRVVSEAGRYGRRAAVLVLDLDGFKLINDRHGHSAGDEIVARVAELLAGSVHERDVVARLGGDEFGIVLLEADRDRAARAAEKIIEMIHSCGAVVGGVIRADLTASVGISLLTDGNQLSAEELLVDADGAMYRAKSRGRNRHAFHEPSERAQSSLAERHSWLERLQRAIDEDLFELHAQPIVGICADGIPRYELLLRLRGEDGELTAPGAFLDNAERFDLIGGIDRWVLGQAVRLLHEQITAGNDISLTVNLSGKTMNDLTIAADLAAMLATRPVPSGRLIVEVTETAAIVNIERASELAADLRSLGCLFALDDFGSGFASFYYLKHLDFDYLKIDGEFISKLVETTADQLVVRAVVDIARGLGTQTIAEFVGDDATVALLKEFGVDYGQGFHLGRPAPLPERLPVLGVAA